MTMDVAESPSGARRGRPPRAGALATSQIKVRVTSAEYDAVYATARSHRYAEVSVFVRDVVLEVAQDPEMLRELFMRRASV